MKTSDKGRWFVTKGGKECVKSITDDFVDTLTIIFRGDWERAKKAVRKFHVASREENLKYEL